VRFNPLPENSRTISARNVTLSVTMPSFLRCSSTAKRTTHHVVLPHLSRAIRSARTIALVPITTPKTEDVGKNESSSDSLTVEVKKAENLEDVNKQLDKLLAGN
jgi:hypothetical protein